MAKSKGRSKPNAAVERLVRKWVRAHGDHALGDEGYRQLITEARLSAARECAEIADDSAKRIARDGTLTGAPAVEYTASRIRQHFNLEER